MGAGRRWTRGRPLRTATIGLAMVTGVLSTGGGVAAAKTADMVYGCRFPSGSQRVTVRVAASLPKARTVGQTVSPSRPTLTVTFPRPALTDLTSLDAATVGATARLTVGVTQSAVSTTTAWDGFTADQTAVSREGDLTLEASGTAQAVRPAASGDVTFAAKSLAIDLLPLKADGTATSPIPLTCDPVSESGTTIGTVAVLAAGTTLPGDATPRATAQADEDFCPPKPTGGLNEKFPRPPIPDGVVETDKRPGPATPACGVIAGFSNVNKLNGSTSLGGVAAIAETLNTWFAFRAGANYLSTENVAVAHLESRRATLLTFGFVPVSATMELTQVGNMNIVTDGPAVQTTPPTNVLAISQGEVDLRLTDARVNGVPLDLGPNCRTVDPVPITLRGFTNAEPLYRVPNGGTLEGDLNIPPFSGCGVGDDLDPLLTASISGPGNTVQITQGPVCDLTQGPKTANPCPPIGFGYTVHPGGEWTGTSSQITIRLVGPVPSGQTISCQSVEMNGTLKSGTKIAPTRIGQITDFSLGECTGTVPPLSGKKFTVTAKSLPWTIHHDVFDSATGTTTAHLQGEALHFSTQGCSFDVANPGSDIIGGNFHYAYVNSSHTMTLKPTGTGSASLLISNVTGCTDGFTVPIAANQRIQLETSISIDPPQTFTAP